MDLSTLIYLAPTLGELRELLITITNSSMTLSIILFLVTLVTKVIRDIHGFYQLQIIDKIVKYAGVSKVNYLYRNV